MTPYVFAVILWNPFVSVKTTRDPLRAQSKPVSVKTTRGPLRTQSNIYDMLFGKIKLLYCLTGFWIRLWLMTKTISKFSDFFAVYLLNHYTLTHFSPMLHFYSPWKCQKTRQKTFGFLTFSGAIEMEYSAKMG